MMQSTAGSTSMVSMLQPSTYAPRFRPAYSAAPTAVQPVMLLEFRKTPPSDRSTNRGTKTQQGGQQQQPPSRPTQPLSPRTYRTTSSKSSSRPTKPDMLESAKGAADKFVCRHDPVTVGFGCLLVTGYCVVAHGQDVGEALRLAGFSTILGMVSGWCAMTKFVIPG
jgi:hypothetical protein